MPKKKMIQWWRQNHHAGCVASHLLGLLLEGQQPAEVAEGQQGNEVESISK